MICLDNKLNNKVKNVISLLNIALSNDISAEEKIGLLQNFGVKTTEKLESEVLNMCNYSKGVFQKGLEKGIEKGINVLISTMIKFKADEDDIVNEISEEYNLSREVAKEFYNNYKKSQNQ